MSTSFIRQQIDMEIHDIMSKLFQQLVDIGEPLVHNEVQQAKELEARSADFCDNSITNTPQRVQLQFQFDTLL